MDGSRYLREDDTYKLCLSEEGIFPKKSLIFRWGSYRLGDLNLSSPILMMINGNEIPKIINNFYT